MSLRVRNSNTIYLLLSLVSILLLWHWLSRSQRPVVYTPLLTDQNSNRYDWSARPLDNPVLSYAQLPRPQGRLPKVQYNFEAEDEASRTLREQRREAIKQTAVRCWKSYHEFAWMHDELTPVSGTSRSSFGGWAATLVDSLDTLWIMDLKDEFAEAVEATLSIDFTNTTSITISVFETNIRYLGGMLAAHDLSGDRRLLDKALELANVLYAAFDTPNRMPINSWNVQNAANLKPQQADYNTLSAEIGTLSLEFTRLTQLTGDQKWYDAIARITDLFAAQQDDSTVPGMWPISVSARSGNFSSGYSYSLGAMADSLYEYLPKMSALLGGSRLYERMYAKAMDAAIRHMIFRPMLPDNADVLVAGQISNFGLDLGLDETMTLQPHGEHLTCFTGGMFALGGKLIRNESHVEVGRKLADGCVWTYANSPHGVMPESFYMHPCASWSDSDCEWDRQVWLGALLEKSSNLEMDGEEVAQRLNIPEGFTKVENGKYDLRPEAIESVFINYRISGDPSLLETGWQMWESIENVTKTPLASSAVQDVMVPYTPTLTDHMESFWLAETLKYFYLLYSPPTVISLDEYVFNTEAHPLLRPKSGWW